MIYPAPIQKGDTIAFISPASEVKAEYVHKAAARIEAAGYRVRIMPHALGAPDGTYSATAKDRLDDFRLAWQDPAVRAVVCTRGGYGCVHWIDEVSDDFLLSDPKWLIGFSDVSALHARLQKAEIASIHGSMARYIADNEAVFTKLEAIMSAALPSFEYKTPCGKFHGARLQAVGTLRGGNLAVLSHLIGTPCDIFSGKGDILFIEDISEAIYATERMLWQLHLDGVLRRASGLVIGEFTQTQPDANYPDTQTMIYERLKQWGYLDRMPVAFGFPVGHIQENIPLIEGAQVMLDCADDIFTLKTITK